MKTCAVCKRPLESGLLVHPECVIDMDEIAEEVMEWIKLREHQYDSRSTPGFREDYIEEAGHISDDPVRAFDEGFEYGMIIALNDLIDLIGDNGWSAFTGG